MRTAFSYEESPNLAPFARDDFAFVIAGSETAIDVLHNDSDPDGAIVPSSVMLVSQPLLGTAEANEDGTINYKPNPDAIGEDSFNYTVADNLGAVSNFATVTVTIEQPPEEPEPDPLLSLNLIIGTDRNDRIIGSEDDDIIFGFAGNDRIEGRDGNDILFGGRGNDRLSGGPGDDILVGGPGNDQLDGGDGIDVALFAGDFADFRITSAGPRVQVQDRVGNEGNNTLTAIDILQFDDGFLDLRDNNFSEGYADDRVEALLTTPGFSTDPDPAFASNFAPSPSIAQVETLVVESET